MYIFFGVLSHAFFFASTLSCTLGLLWESESMDAAMGAGACSDVVVLNIAICKICVMLMNKRRIRGLVDTLKYELEVQHPPLRAACRRHDERVNELASKVNPTS